MIIKNKSYISADIGTHVLAVKNKVIAFIDSIKGKTEEQRINLPKIKNLLHQAVDYIQLSLPVGVDRVDGNVIEPLLKEQVNIQIKALAPVKETVDEEVA